MKDIALVLLLMICGSTHAQTKIFSKKGVAIDGYDVVSYFENKAEKGKVEWSTEFNNTKFYFSSSDHLAQFLKDPENYIPKYGGYCAYAMALKGKKVSVDLETFEIRDGNLYLFYNKWGNNTLKDWLDEDPEKLIPMADKNFKVFLKKE